MFRLKDHPKADRCYVWAELVDDVSGKQRFYAILHVPPADSPLAAVRASIVQEARRGERMPEQEDSLDRIADAFEKVADELNSILDRIEAHTEAMHNLSRSVWEIASAIRGEPRAE